MKHVRTAEDPTGQRYLLVAAPPGSALDADTGEARGGLLGALTGGIVILVRALRSEWRVAVTPCDAQGRTNGTTRRERVADEQAAEARLTVIAQEIREGRWPPEE